MYILFDIKNKSLCNTSVNSIHKIKYNKAIFKTTGNMQLDQKVTNSIWIQSNVSSLLYSGRKSGHCNGVNVFTGQAPPGAWTLFPGICLRSLVLCRFLFHGLSIVHLIEQAWHDSHGWWGNVTYLLPTSMLSLIKWEIMFKISRAKKINKIKMLMKNLNIVQI